MEYEILLQIVNMNGKTALLYILMLLSGWSLIHSYNFEYVILQLPVPVAARSKA